MIEQGFELKSVNKLGANKQRSFECVGIGKKAGREISQFGIS